MSQRITQADLVNTVNRINQAAGTPAEPYTEIDGKFTPNANCYHLAGAYGGVKMEQMSPKLGCTGTSDALGTGFVTKRELYVAMHAFLKGLESR